MKTQTEIERENEILRTALDRLHTECETAVSVSYWYRLDPHAKEAREMALTALAMGRKGPLDDFYDECQKQGFDPNDQPTSNP